MAETILFPGRVEWSGENPGISLKEQPDGPFTVLASFFRVVLSPHGRGHALVLLQSPGEEAPPPERSATGLHSMPNLFVPCERAGITVNSRALPGQPVPREIAGRRITTAMLAFSETEIRT